ncbi:GNAT family N-acetyltransferase [Candidatus Bipolaricaulota bacterium]|nr:GNAT family N-acetyltransferase [Candidatus Bipolaricaulota bacterium]
MTTCRSYHHEQDYAAIDEFLIRMAQEFPDYEGWPQPRWEYMHSHPGLDRDHLDAIGVWESEGEIVGLVHHEGKMGVLYIQLDPRFSSLNKEMMAYAAEHLAGVFKIGKAVHVYIDDTNPDLERAAAELGYEKLPAGFDEPHTRLIIPDPFPEISVPDGFRIQSLDDEFDVAKVHRVMHRGFDHDGEPPADELDDRRRKLSAPNFRRDLTIVAVSEEDGAYVSFAGIWPVPGSTSCYLEPVATDPDYRRMGLGRATVMEAVRRCVLEGATVAFGGADTPFYLSMGFQLYRRRCAWRKIIEPKA